MKAILIARVSTDEQQEKNNSLPAQIDKMRRYCEVHGYVIEREYSISESAYKDTRDEFDKAVQFVSEQREKVIVCFDKVDRLSRNVFDPRVALLHKLANEDKIELHFVSDHQVVKGDLSAAEKTRFGMDLLMASYYSNAISDNVKRTYEKMRREGKWTGPAPLGYVNVGDEGRKDIIPDVIKAPLIIKLFETFATGNYSTTAIWEYSKEIGLKNKYNQHLSRSVLPKILHNTFYIGVAPSQKYGPYPHCYKSIISRDLFQRCQDIFAERSTKKTHEAVEFIFPFSGLLDCPHCGCAMSADPKKNGKHVYYRCSRGKRQIHDKYYAVSEKTLLEPVYELLDRLEAIPEAAKERLVQELRNNHEAEKAYHQSQVARIQTEYTRLQTMMGNLVDKIAESDDSTTQDLYEKKLHEYKHKQGLLGIELEEYTKADYGYKITLTTILKLVSNIKKIFERSKPAEKRAMLKFLLSNPHLKEKKLYFSIASPFSELLEYASCPDGLRG